MAAAFGQLVRLRLPCMALFGPDALAIVGIVEGLDRIVADRGHRLVAEDALVHEGEVRHVEEVLDDARRAAGHVIRATDHLAQVGIVVFGEGQHIMRGCADAGPDQAIGLFRRVDPDLAFQVAFLQVRQRRYAMAAALLAEAPAMVGAGQGIDFQHAHRQLHAAMRAAVFPRMQLARAVAPDHELRVEQGRGQHAAGFQAVGDGDWVPVIQCDRVNERFGVQGNGVHLRNDTGQVGRISG